MLDEHIQDGLVYSVLNNTAMFNARKKQIIKYLIDNNLASKELCLEIIQRSKQSFVTRNKSRAQEYDIFKIFVDELNVV